jgi:uncharacterized membrane-anchored protein
VAYGRYYLAQHARGPGTAAAWLAVLLVSQLVVLVWPPLLLVLSSLLLPPSLVPLALVLVLV